MNLALRDIDFSNATEEAQFNKKRSFYPLEEMDASNPLPDSNVINYAAKKTVHKNNYPVYKTVPFIKQEYFNRIYWSKPNVSESFLNSFRMVYTDQYKEYNKEFEQYDYDIEPLPQEPGKYGCWIMHIFNIHTQEEVARYG